MSHYRSTYNQRGSASSFRRRKSNKRPSSQSIHPSKFIRAARPVTEEPYVAVHSFADFEVHPLIKDNLQQMGFSTPSAIQDEAIPVILKGKNIVGIANTGTGKTAAFAVPTITKLMNNQDSKVLILAPTRELAQQIQEQCRRIGKGSGLYDALLIGGTPMGPQFRDLRDEPRVVIGTPGRIKDHIERGSLDLTNFDTVILDEVDRMLDMGFISDIRDILSQTSEERQNLFFSATMNPQVNQIISQFSRDPEYISVKSGETSDNVEQDVIRFTSNQHRMEQLSNLLENNEVEKAIIFGETQRSVEQLAYDLQDRGFRVDSIHGGKTQGKRQSVFKKFKRNDITILVATDVAARGLDVSDITHVVNYTVPQSYEDYVHRIGRTGRAGKTGFAFTFVKH